MADPPLNFGDPAVVPATKDNKKVHKGTNKLDIEVANVAARQRQLDIEAANAATKAKDAVLTIMSVDLSKMSEKTRSWFEAR
ncbi:hypothetical protein D1007_56279 [Hordeum vulgare]|nr:hypothetical protein D1007_56279 [Hordeum vulgare]